MPSPVPDRFQVLEIKYPGVRSVLVSPVHVSVMVVCDSLLIVRMICQDRLEKEFLRRLSFPQKTHQLRMLRVIMKAILNHIPWITAPHKSLRQLQVFAEDHAGSCVPFEHK